MERKALWFAKSKTIQNSTNGPERPEIKSVLNELKTSQ
ncbi:hypothetical protein CCACVL1_03342 [Corchorus capsularis]|uniref:Uncharacterized protein n=1 Tax=Corchorus capsularis TaxID=210143 RepID=A0A1R3K095_COCAP|nr:hypothetical protein CCACVL1_03342 [Corchorus capsularis]